MDADRLPGGLGVWAGDSLPNLNPRWGAPVTPQTQPALYAVVEDVAGRLGVSKPDRMC